MAYQPSENAKTHVWDDVTGPPVDFRDGMISRARGIIATNSRLVVILPPGPRRILIDGDPGEVDRAVRAVAAMNRLARSGLKYWNLQMPAAVWEIHLNQEMSRRDRKLALWHVRKAFCADYAQGFVCEALGYPNRLDTDGSRRGAADARWYFNPRPSWSEIL